MRGVKMVSNEFINDGNIYDGARTFAGVTLIPHDCEGGFGIFQFYRIVRKWTNR